MTLDQPPVAPPTPVTVQCVRQAAQRLEVPLALVKAVLTVEGGTPGKVTRHPNGAHDIGPMQINVRTVADLKGVGLADPIKLRDSGCYNVLAGTWLLSRHYLASGSSPAKRSWARAAGNYHSKTPKYHQRYQRKVLQALRQPLSLKAVVARINKGIRRTQAQIAWSNPSE